MNVDSAGIYRTKNDFLTGNLSYLSNRRLKIKSDPFRLRFPLSYDWDEAIYLPQPDKTEVKIYPDSVFGFVANGIKFVYIDTEKKYLSVLHDKGPLYFFLKEKILYGGRFSRLEDILLYTPNLATPVKEFTIENIQYDFSSNQALRNQLLKLRNDIKKNHFFSRVDRNGFFEYQVLIRKGLGEDTSSH